MKTFFVVPRRREEEEGKQQQKSNKAPFSHPASLEIAFSPASFRGTKGSLKKDFYWHSSEATRQEIFCRHPMTPATYCTRCGERR